MAVPQNIHETYGDMKNKVCNSLGIQSFNTMTSSEYPAYQYYRNNRKESVDGRIHNHDMLF